MAIVSAALAGMLNWLGEKRFENRLLRTQAAQLVADRDLLDGAVRRARPLFGEHCAGCHGTALGGNAARGVPNLAGNGWLYGSDPVDVERTILYGIRSGHPKARNLTDMPGEVRSGQITTGDALDVVEYLQALAGAANDAAMAKRGRELYFGKGNCYDCHADDAQGVIDYGTPALTGPVWLYGGDRGSLMNSVVNGRHGICPAWIDKLSFAQVRELTLFMTTTASPGP